MLEIELKEILRDDMWKMKEKEIKEDFQDSGLNNTGLAEVAKIRQGRV